DDPHRGHEADGGGGVPPPVVRTVIEHHTRQDQQRERGRDRGDAACPREEARPLDPRREQPVERASSAGHPRYSTRRAEAGTTVRSAEATVWSEGPFRIGAGASSCPRNGGTR